MKGIILAGGAGSRLYPLTLAITKQLLPVFDKPMIYYPLSVLMNLGIREICIISTYEDKPRFESVLKNGAHLGIDISYRIQKQPKGIAEALIIAQDFIQDSEVALILGDNIYYGNGLLSTLTHAKQTFSGAAIFGYRVNNPSRYGVLEFSKEGQVKAIIEKPTHPPSNYAVTGLYFYDHNAASFAKKLHPSKRGELEITDLNQLYLDHNLLSVHLFEEGLAWLDMGTHEALHEASSFVQTIQKRQGIQIACIEEIALKKGWIDIEQLEQLAQEISQSSYGQYLLQILQIYSNETNIRALIS